MERIQELLLAHERVAKGQQGSNEVTKDDESKDELSKKESNVLDLKNITAAWPETKEPVLKDLNLSVEKCSLIGIIGQVSSGKSSFLSLLLNELEILLVHFTPMLKSICSTVLLLSIQKSGMPYYT